ncbi:MlaC/ttg2D family ABC transporter substrate-binding protein [Stigmatella aurantiaca]|uniref:Toluene tolerance protein Ttg2D n=1 Tax=Stigmatella aurantiaca (strain DW4/3-1) TaxID=378806 RepID=Q08T12_STIAD|nr:ABC transporter substrate-binding protein [Stigmatella aurantiaca]ADO72024.1 toluene tolerance-like protein [Stigmatella aurantiaca DW4/3-1]EAU63627.1 toluene tolerance protein Ttg2D [Stigmatella aurantiaca DW4/3-1]
MIASLLTATLLAAAPGPLDVVKSGNADVQKAASAPGATVEQLATVVEKFVDFEELSKRALGKNWDTLNATQRKDFTETMKGLLRASYAQKAIGQAQADVKYGKETIEGDEATVDTTLTVKKDQVPVGYKLYKAAGKGNWRIYDVVTDDVSLVETYRGQFRKLLADKGFDGLLSTLKAKRAQLEKSSASTAAPAPGGVGAKAQATSTSQTAPAAKVQKQ